MPPTKRKFYGGPIFGGKRHKADYTHLARHRAAAAIQSRFRSYRARRRRFTGRVQAAVRRGEPQQYYIKNLLNQTAVTQAPYSYDISNIYYNKTDQGLPNPKWYRSSNKVYVQNMHLNVRVTASKDDFNKVCICLVRHKRSAPIDSNDLQTLQAVPPAVIPQLTLDEAPFMPINQGSAGAINPTAVDLNFGSTTANANVDALASFFNPKVIDLLWHKTVTVQPLKSNVVPGATSNVTFPTGWPYIREFDFNKKFNEVWSFPSPPAGTAGDQVYPIINNKCYSLIVWSDSISSSASHPIVDCSMRLSFKDKD